MRLRIGCCNQAPSIRTKYIYVCILVQLSVPSFVPLPSWTQHAPSTSKHLLAPSGRRRQRQARGNEDKSPNTVGKFVRPMTSHKRSCCVVLMAGSEEGRWVWRAWDAPRMQSTLQGQLYFCHQALLHTLHNCALHNCNHAEQLHTYLSVIRGGQHAGTSAPALVVSNKKSGMLHASSYLYYVRKYIHSLALRSLQ